MEPRTVVRHKASGTCGVTLSDLAYKCGKDEVPVVFEGGKDAFKVLVSDLEVVGPEDAKADFEKCGVGKGEYCCIFFTLGAGGPECARFNSLRWAIIKREREGTMNAKRHPTALYPKCQLTNK